MIYHDRGNVVHEPSGLEPLGDSSLLAVSWRFLGGSSLGLGSARASSPGVPCAEPAREQH